MLKNIFQIGLLFLLSLIGEGFHRFLHIPIPGSVIGLLLLFAGLCFKIIPVKWIEGGAGFILAYLPLFFLPALVGVMNYPILLTWDGLLVVIIIVLSTIVTIIAAGMTSQLLERQIQRRRGE